MQNPSLLDRAAAEIDRFRGTASADLLDVLQAVQGAVGFVPPQMVPLIAEVTGAERPVIYKAIEITPSLTLQPPGKHTVFICSADNCCSKGGTELAKTAQDVLGIPFYHSTADGNVRIEPFHCLGNCAYGPNVMIDRTIYGPVTPEALREKLEALRVS